MSWSPIDLMLPQYQNPADNTPFSGAVLKAYAAGTTSNISMATDATGGTTFTSIALNASGYPEHNSAIVIPHIDQNYKLAFYATQAEADADTPAIWSIDDNVPINITNDFSLEDNVSNDSSIVSNFTHTTTGTPVAGIGTAIGFITETAVGSNELGMQLQSVATDVTPGSEDFKFRVQLMAGGATAVNVFEVDSAAVFKFLLPNPQILGGDTDGAFYVGAGAANILGAGVTFYGDTHATKAGDIEFMKDGAVKLSYDFSTTTWNVPETLSVTGDLIASGLTYPTADGSSGYSLQTDGAGNLSFAAAEGVALTNRTSNTILAGADSGKFIDITAGTFTQTFTAAATLAANWWCYIRNSGTGDITLDPDGSETIDGETSYIMYPSEVRLVQCNGTSFKTILITPFAKTFTSSGSVTVPPGYKSIGGMIWAAGASGQRTNNTGVASIGGGGGGCFPFNVPVSLLSGAQTVTVGAGGAAVTTVANGNVGGFSAFGVLKVFGQSSWTSGSAIGITSGFTQGISNGNSATGFGAISFTQGNPSAYGGGNASTVPDQPGGSSVYGGGAGGSITSAAALFNPGSSLLAGSGGAAVSAGNGTDGTFPAGGGGATQTGAQSGAGANGQVIVWGVA